MNKIKLRRQGEILTFVSIIFLFFTCTSQLDNVEISDRNIDVSQISRILLKPSSTKLVADGKAQINLTPIVYIKNNDKEIMLPPERVREEWFEYSSSSTTPIARLFSTSDKGLLNKTIDVTVKVKNKPEIFANASFQITGGLPEKYRTEAVFPVVFHIIRTTDEIQSSGLTFEKQLFYNALQKLNNAFSGVMSKNAVGTDTYIRFKPAEYAPEGNKLAEAGINRITVSKVEFPNYEVIEKQKLVWNPTQYLNIWLVSEPGEAYGAKMQFARFQFLPRYRKPGTPTDEPLGLNLKEFTENQTFTTDQSGVLYRLQDLNALSKSYDLMSGYIPEINDLTHYIGSYLGLLPTNRFRVPPPYDDYCDDTVIYLAMPPFFKDNKSLMKETEKCFFMSENIMDDPSGLHKSVSVQQAIRMRWVLENCPERSSWKSSFAFTGK